MSKKPAKTTQAEINRAAKVAQKLNMSVRVLTDGIIELVPIDRKDQIEPQPQRARVLF